MRTDLQKILVCPICRASLLWTETRCRCNGCNTEYSIDAGVPVLIADSGLPVEAVRASERDQLIARLGRHPWLRVIVNALRPPLPYDTYGRTKGQRIFDQSIPKERGRRVFVLNLGAGSKGEGQLRGLSAETRAELISTDIQADSGVDFVSDAHQIPLESESLDGLVFQGVVEHVGRPWVVAAEIQRVLKPGGVVFCEAPFMQWFHEDPKDYYRFTEDGLKMLFDQCEPISSGIAIGPVGGAIGVARELIPIIFNNAYLYWITKWIVAWLTWPLVIFDRLYRRASRAKTIALAVYLVARKR